MKLTIAKLLKNILFKIIIVAVLWGIVREIWIALELFPLVDDRFPELYIPIGLAILVMLLTYSDISAANDKWERFIDLLVMGTSVLVFCNVSRAIYDANVRVSRISSLSAKNIDSLWKTDYLYIDHLQVDTATSGDYFDYEIINHSRGGSSIKFYLYRACPLKNVKGVFVVDRLSEEHSYSFANEAKLQEYKVKFINRNNEKIKQTAVRANFFKVVKPSNGKKAFQEAAADCITTYGYIAPNEQQLLEIATPDAVDGWQNNVLWIVGALAVCTLLLSLVFLFAGISGAEYQENKRDIAAFTSWIRGYFSYPENLLVLLLPLIMVLIFVLMVLSGYNLFASDTAFLHEWGSCSAYDLMEKGEGWRLFTSLFLHLDMVHLIGNLLGYALGVYLLSNFLKGKAIFGVFLISGILSMLVAVFVTGGNVIGASGGIFGLYGAYVVMLLARRIRKRNTSLAGLVGLGIFLFIQLIYSFQPWISLSAHLAGFGIGVLSALVLAATRWKGAVCKG